MKSRRLWLVPPTLTLLSGCGGQNAQSPSPPAQADSVRWSKPQAVDGQVGKPAPRADPPRVRLERVGHLSGEPGDPIADLVVAGNYAYVTQHDELRVIDVSEPTRPRVVGTLGFKEPATVRSVSDRHLYVASGPSTSRAADCSARCAARPPG
jgi:hypothetical protein